ncbi:MAG: primosomal protein N', partial [Erysipelotrichaceae bacterium]|nr:primosomal protein N' [Erysipelotrichaceae bacterium]
MKDMIRIVQCWIEHPVRKLDQTFTYLYEGKIEPGCRVEISFGTRTLTGFAESVEESEESREEIEARLGMKLKDIDRVIDEESLITDELHDLALWLRNETLSTAIACFQTMLPGKLKPAGGRSQTVKEKIVKLSEKEVSLTPKQLEAYLYVKDHPGITYTQLRKEYPNQARALVEKEAVILEEKEKEAVPMRAEIPQEDLVLRPEQQKAMDEIRNSDDAVFLLEGITGSGKTEIYLQLAKEALNQGKQVLILVPEIALTPQMISRVKQRFSDGLAIYHSGLSDQEKYEQYRLVKTGQASIVVGTRSAVFLPFASLGLIVLDEEHDSSYKQDSQPCYHCRNVAIYRGRYHHCKVILGSATPSLDSYARALKKVYHLVSLKERINRTLPEVTIVPVRESIRKGGSYILTDVLKEKIRERLDRNEQIILLLNRRGYSAQLRCRSCQEVLKCPHCDLAMSWHHDIKMLKCHTCGTMLHTPSSCPVCGSREGFMSYGFGTQRLQEETERAFPGARILRMDADTTSRRNAHAKILSAFADHQADILLGTQMIAKGLDYPDVTLVGIVNGDEGLSRTDFRSCEVTFDLLMQASGRSGRGDKHGEVVMQVYDPGHYA